MSFCYIGNKLALPHEAVVEAFNRVDRAFGREWIEASRVNQGDLHQGTSPTRHVIITAHEIVALDGVVGADRLLELLREGDPAAGAETMALHLLRTGRPSVEGELYPSAQVGTHRRQPDFRVREPDGAWTYVEVTQPNLS
jgi:hypothetical protein